MEKGALTLTRRTGQSVVIGGVEVVVMKVGRGQVQLRIVADRSVPIVRGELEKGVA
jgi:carbon storage regulator CsrA